MQLFGFYKRYIPGRLEPEIIYISSFEKIFLFLPRIRLFTDGKLTYKKLEREIELKKVRLDVIPKTSANFYTYKELIKELDPDGYRVLTLEIVPKINPKKHPLMDTGIPGLDLYIVQDQKHQKLIREKEKLVEKEEFMKMKKKPTHTMKPTKKNPNCKTKKQETCYIKNSKRMCYCKNPPPTRYKILENEATGRSYVTLTDLVKNFQGNGLVIGFLRNKYSKAQSAQQFVLIRNIYNDLYEILNEDQIIEIFNNDYLNEVYDQAVDYVDILN